jgi:hypothetical protein
MKQIETELLKNSDYEERINELEKLNEELKHSLNETKAVVNDIKFKQLNSLDCLNNIMYINKNKNKNFINF